jgi:hypothetical protein
MRHYSCMTAFVLLFAAWPGPSASAQESVADTLFNKGLKDMEEGRFDAGCPAIGESYQIDPQLGSLFAFADCLRRANKIAGAVARYDEYLQKFARRTAQERKDQRGREKIAALQKAELAPQVPSVTLVVASVPQGTRITLDGVEITPASLGVALPVDPGEHTIVLQAPGVPEDDLRFTIARGEKQSIVLRLEAPAKRPEPPPITPPPSVIPVAPAEDDVVSGQRVAAYLAGGVGVAGIAMGIVTGALVFEKKGIVDDNCVGTICNEDGKTAADDARPLALASNLGFGIGAGALIAGTVLILTEPRAPRVGNTKKWVSADAAPLGEEGAVLRVKGAW